jgi:hypothetical protein
MSYNVSFGLSLSLLISVVYGLDFRAGLPTASHYQILKMFLVKLLFSNLKKKKKSRTKIDLLTDLV